MTACNGPAVCETNNGCHRKEINPVRNRSVIYHSEIVNQTSLWSCNAENILKTAVPS